MLIYLLAGLILFLGVHSTRMLADEWRTRSIERIGAKPWKGLYALASLAGFVLLVWGFGVARQQPVQLWSPPVGMRHLASALTWVAFVLLAAAEVPGNHIKARLHHPMLLGTKVWALAHLLANGTLADIILFGSFLLWAVLLFKTARRRAIPMGFAGDGPTKVGTLMTVVVGVLAWLVFAAWLHVHLIGISPFSR